jgi:catechol 2,3-dioxygenase
MSANGYHHHLGGNTWAGENLRPAPSDAARLLWYEIVIPDAEAVTTIAEKLGRAGKSSEYVDNVLRVTDPSGINLRLSYTG